MGRVTRGQGIAAIVFGIFEIIMGIVITIACFLIKEFLKLFKGLLIAVFIILAAQYILPGILGIIAGAKKNIGCMIAFLVLNIIACVIQTVGIVIVTILTAGGWTVFISSFLPVLITFGSSILGCVSVCCTPAETNDLNVQVNPYPVAVVGFPEPPQFQTPEYPGAVGGFPDPPPYEAPEVVELPEIDVKSGNF